MLINFPKIVFLEISRARVCEPAIARGLLVIQDYSRGLLFVPENMFLGLFVRNLLAVVRNLSGSSSCPSGIQQAAEGRGIDHKD